MDDFEDRRRGLRVAMVGAVRRLPEVFLVVENALEVRQIGLVDGHIGHRRLKRKRFACEARESSTGRYLRFHPVRARAIARDACVGSRCRCRVASAWREPPPARRADGSAGHAVRY